MKIIFNGTPREIQEGCTIQEFLDQSKLDCLQVVVEHNGDIIPRQRLADKALRADDALEVIHFVGGG